MRNSIKLFATFATLILACTSFVAQAQWSDQMILTPEQQREHARYKEIIITTEVDYDGGLFGGGKQKVTIEGVLILPDPTLWKAPYPLAVFNHGSQSYPSPVNFVAFEGDAPNQRYLTYFFTLRGYAVFFPIRKGFTRKGGPDSKASLRVSEPIDDYCNGSLQEAGLQSAKSDVKALLEVLRKEQPDINMGKIVMTGLSRGGIASLDLVADGYPGVVGIINWSGRWYGQYCSQRLSFQNELFRKFGEKIRVPILSVYGDKDPEQPIEMIRNYLSELEKENQKARVLILPGQGHYSPIRIGNWFQNARIFMRQF